MSAPPGFWQSEVQAYFRDHGAEHGLDAATLEVRYVLNWGGFVNHSFVVRDRSQRLHLKLADQHKAQDALVRWCKLDGLLRVHRAPPVLAQLEIGNATALLFPHRPGTSPVLTAELLRELLPALRRLWSDGALRERLHPSAPPTARQGYLDTYHDRFVQDLYAITAAPPPFVTSGVLDCLHAEVATLESRVAAAPSFEEAVSTPVHGDLWLNNILWVGPAEWSLLDWDDVHIGDPAMDLATLLGPSARDLEPLKLQAGVAPYLTASQRDRLPLLGRASLLDWVIDPLADWIEADDVPAVRDEVRAEKQRVHAAAWTLYRERFGV